MSVLNNNAAFTKAILGVKVEKTITLPASGATADIFTVDGGSVLLTGFYGDVETALAAATDLQILLDPDDGGSNVTLASTLEADSDATGTIYTLNTTAGGALVAGTDVGYNAKLASPIVLTPGDLVVDVAGGTGGTGVVHWYAFWIPLDDGAALTAA